MTRLRGLFERLRTEKRAALVPYLTAGDPDPRTTVEYALALGEGGADLIELGVPFSDPLADGPVIQRASERALAAGTRLDDVLRCAEEIARSSLPVVLMTYVNPVLRRGWERFASDAGAAGVWGVILTDVPPEEAAPFLPAAERADLGTIFLVAPTSGPARIADAVRTTTGFLYCVSRLGVTGERRTLSDSFRPVLDRVRRATDLPVALGFGISTPEQAREAARLADGVVVGSRLVAIAEEAGTPAGAAKALRRAAGELRKAIEEARR
jgi:tryptophan synthase alpha chain